MKLRLASPIVVALLALLCWRSVFIVDQSHSALLTRFGRIAGGQLDAGLHFKSPLDQVHQFDRRIITRAYTGESFLSGDDKALNVDFYLKWRLSDLARYYQSTGGDEDMAAMRLADLVSGRIKTAVAQEPLTRVTVSSRAALGEGGFQQLRAAARELGVDLLDVQLARIDLADEAANTVYQRMEQTFTARAQQLHADAASEADKIRADADLKHADILADATRAAQKLRGQADARAAAIYAQAYGRNPDLAALYQSLQAYKSTIGREGDIVVISPQGEFFKYLHSASGR